MPINSPRVSKQLRDTQLVSEFLSRQHEEVPSGTHVVILVDCIIKRIS